MSLTIVDDKYLGRIGAAIWRPVNAATGAGRPARPSTIGSIALLRFEDVGRVEPLDQ